MSASASRGGGARAGRQRPFGEDRRRIRTDGQPSPTCSTASAVRLEHGRGLLAHVRRHAQPWAAWNSSSRTAGRARTTPTSTTPEGAAWHGRCSTPSTPESRKSTPSSGSPAWRRTAAQAVLDSARRAAVDRSILPSSAPLNPRAANDLSRNGRHHRQAPGAVCLRRLLAADFQQRAVPVPLRGIPARLQRLPPRTDGPLVYVIAFSLYFYYKSSGTYFLLLVFAAASDFLSARGIYRARFRWTKRWLVVLSVAVNLGMLGYFKYTNFLIDISNQLFGPRLPAIPEHLPPGRHLVLQFSSR